jgi:asparagine synthase (glutamine-hydrolysing)
LRVDLIATGDDLPAAARLVAEAGRRYLLVSEKVVAVAQGRGYRVDEVHYGLWARTLFRFVNRTPYGIGLGHPATMQLAIREIGLPRILLAPAAVRPRSPRTACWPHKGDGEPATASAATFGGTVVIDANDLGQDVLGTETHRPEVVAAFADNPLGHAWEQTPFAAPRWGDGMGPRRPG